MSHVGASAVCGFCGEATVVDWQGRCQVCAGPFKLLEPLAVECGWCGVSNRRDLVAACVRCGGHLPALPGGNPGAVPPPVPRWLPPGYENRVRYWKNVRTLIGIIFTIPFFWSIVFPVVGILLWISGARMARRKLSALRHGIPTRGRIVDIAVDTSQAINDRHPWKISYAFDTPGGTLRGEATAWDAASVRRSVGDVIWIVYNPAAIDENEIWPPIH